MPSAYRQFRGRCLQKIIAGLAVGLAGVALALSEVGFGAVVVPGNPVLGIVIAVVGVLYAVHAALTLRRRRKPAVRG